MAKKTNHLKHLHAALENAHKHLNELAKQLEPKKELVKKTNPKKKKTV